MSGPTESLAPTEPLPLAPGRRTSSWTEPTTSASAAGGTEQTLRFDDEHGAIDPGVADSERYVFGEAFAAGGIGVVRRGSDRRLGRVIAIKELLHDSPRAQQRFAPRIRCLADPMPKLCRFEHRALSWPELP